jgi:alkylation response protein AidB-like acyl-CoA dehydrogenase
MEIDAFVTATPLQDRFLANLHERVRRFGEEADRLANIPAGFFEGVHNSTMTGLRAVRVSRIVLKDCFVPSENLLGHDTEIDLARSFSFALASFNAMRPCLSAIIVGAALGIIDHLVQKNGTRVFPRAPLSALIDQFAGPLRSAQLLCWNTARSLDNGIHSLSYHQ